MQNVGLYAQEQGFVPSLLRAQDAICALQVHGEQGARLSLAMVTSEMLANHKRLNNHIHSKYV